MKPDKIEKFPFRDGDDHCGEATFDELYDGFNDGELSDNCIVFKDDDWVTIQSFLDGRKKAKNDKEAAATSISAQIMSTPLINHNASDVIDSSREKKKPSRDSSSWGKNVSIAGPLVASANGVSNSGVTNQCNTTNGHQSQLNGSKKRKLKNGNHIRPPPKLMKYVIQGIMQFDMIQDGDRLLLGLSGGKDSLSLLHCLLELKRKLPTKFEIEVCTIDPMTPSFDPSPLIPYVESLGLKYHYVKDNIVERANSGGKFNATISALHILYIHALIISCHIAIGKNGTVVTSLCAYCARMKRGNLYSTARVSLLLKLVLD